MIKSLQIDRGAITGALIFEGKAKNEAEARKILVIAEAEAEARAKELQGVGIARQRLAIANGLKDSVAACSEAGISPEEATRMVLLTQHYDTVTSVGANSKSTIMMIPYTPDGMVQVGDQITQALLISNEAQLPPATPRKPTGRGDHAAVHHGTHADRKS